MLIHFQCKVHHLRHVINQVCISGTKQNRLQIKARLVTSKWDGDVLKRLDTRRTASADERRPVLPEGLLTKCCQKCCVQKHVDSQRAYGTSKPRVSGAVEVVWRRAHVQSGRGGSVTSRADSQSKGTLTSYQQRQLLTLVKTGSWRSRGLCCAFGDGA